MPTTSDDREGIEQNEHPVADDIKDRLRMWLEMVSFAGSVGKVQLGNSDAKVSLGLLVQNEEGDGRVSAQFDWPPFLADITELVNGKAITLTAAIDHLDLMLPAGLVRRADWDPNWYMGLDENGLYFSAGKPGVEKYVMIDMHLTAEDFTATWEILELPEDEYVLLEENREVS